MKIRTQAFLAAAFFLAASAHAQRCELTDKVIDCWMRFNPGAIGTDVTANTTAEAQTQKTVAAANTGIPSLLSPSGSALKDFLSLLSASAESSSLTTEGHALTLDVNPRIEILGTDHALKLQATFAKPALNDQLTTHFAGDAAALQPFEDALTDFDDVGLSMTVQPTSERFGRSIRPHRQLFRLMMNALAPSRAEWLAKLGDAVAKTTLTSEDQTFASLPEAEQETAMQAIESAAKSQQAFLSTVGRFAGQFARLLNNQPQLYGSALYNSRKNIVGPNEWTAKFTYEMAPNNLNSFRRKYGSECDERALAAKTVAAHCASLLQRFLPAANVADDRLTFTLEYHRTNQRWIKGDPDLGGFEFGYPRAHNLAYELTYGRTVQGQSLGSSSGRIDLKFRYDDVNNPADTSLNVRSKGIGSITYTQKLSDSVSIPIALVYANHSSDLGTVNKKFNAHFGLVYKLPTGSQ